MAGKSDADLPLASMATNRRLRPVRGDQCCGDAVALEIRAHEVDQLEIRLGARRIEAGELGVSSSVVGFQGSVPREPVFGYELGGLRVEALTPARAFTASTSRLRGGASVTSESISLRAPRALPLSTASSKAAVFAFDGQCSPTACARIAATTDESPLVGRRWVEIIVSLMFRHMIALAERPFIAKRGGIGVGPRQGGAYLAAFSAWPRRSAFEVAWVLQADSTGAGCGRRCRARRVPLASAADASWSAGWVTRLLASPRLLLICRRSERVHEAERGRLHRP